ncbi:hypothetical protein E4T42_01435 [Aureobasidium subglaciale]|uniref:Copper acquisition factor BIM1-like domain-containing protein n=1 Tax=Aureobasidium subglaciale (strain EXF-2481) TaxID=1043005 RepID=A0A074Z2Y7_AURSE|nr:uncharacterized protein AUEXF2481DRAFT_541 [Aureobasidium subglaciale EXF-2481]KAI5210281.1 hypothetical protein E4T38_02151 [Aureobasidium subglaciale]KAI5228977.1 hypothetical protein E4T40_01743 [Aureobasidium subglaciale]KAI5232769.1 hypothetical protein E4T41_01963 [Aureobasidium subglaciale]KAI5256843.1 hypothetical protein E4T42_01435 [Aureobasidium subglaciale]KAI5266134.1 hypothetical protein E4T46_01928 [Aureobasidium subglaciale]
MKTQLLLGALLPLVSAHFNLVYPVARGFDEDQLGQFPCGSQNTVSSNRTQFPITGAPIQLLMGHTSAKVEVFMALGNDPGSNFNITLLPTFQERGPQNFCIGAGALQFPAGLNITDGMNATIQVVTNGDPSGGLYNCADITFTSTQLSTADYSSHCQNSTGVSVAALSNAGFANGTSSDATASTSAAPSGSTSAAAATGSGTSTGAASQATFAGFALGAMGVLAGMAAL